MLPKSSRATGGIDDPSFKIQLCSGVGFCSLGKELVLTHKQNEKRKLPKLISLKEAWVLDSSDLICRSEGGRGWGEGGGWGVGRWKRLCKSGG